MASCRTAVIMARAERFVHAVPSCLEAAPAMMHTQHPGRVAMRRRGQEAREEQAHSAAGHDSAVPIRGGPGGAVREGGLHPREHGVQGIGCQHQASVSPAVIACGNAAVTFSRSVRRRTPEDPGPSCGPRSALLPSSSWRQQPFTGCESEIKTRADRPTRIDGTKPLWKAGQAIVGFAGVSVAHFGGDTTLLLCQGAYRTFSDRCCCYPMILAVPLGMA